MTEPTCDHKFVDSERCLKCGWEPAPRHVLVNYCDGTTSGQAESLRECPDCRCVTFVESADDHREVCPARTGKR